MKKAITTFLALLLVLCALCTFVACDPATFYFDHEYLSDIVSVELIRYDNPEQKHFISWVSDHTADLKPFDDSKLSVLETLEADKISDFLDTLIECPILFKYYAFDSPNGLCLKLTYSNGDFIIINCYEQSFAGYIGKFSFNGEVAEFIGCFVGYDCFETLVNDYFQTKIYISKK